MTEKNGRENQMTEKTDPKKQSNGSARQSKAREGIKSDKPNAEISQESQGEERQTSTALDENDKGKTGAKGLSNQGAKKSETKAKNGKQERKIISNNLRENRIEQMMSKAELARKAGLSVLTIDRIEKGYGCRMDTKRKILKALGLKLTDRRKVFKEG